MASPLFECLEGAKIEYVERLAEAGKIVIVFGFRGTDDDSGYFVADEASIRLNEGDPAAWRKGLNSL